MKKQYMDFVPAGAAAKKKTATKKAVKKPAAAKPTTGVVRGSTVGKAGRPAARTVRETETVAFAGEKKPRLGAVEDLSPKFVKTDVPKRPLSSASHFATKKTGVAAAKAQKVGARGAAVKTGVRSVEKPVEKSSGKKGEVGTYQTPKSPFINQGKVQKRPLSKNVYAKKVVVPMEEPKGPVTIISKPEKQAHVGMIVTIILTIILGAAAGTVAFLLLPK